MRLSTSDCSPSGSGLIREDARPEDRPFELVLPLHQLLVRFVLPPHVVRYRFPHLLRHFAVFVVLQNMQVCKIPSSVSALLKQGALCLHSMKGSRCPDGYPYS